MAEAPAVLAITLTQDLVLGKERGLLFTYITPNPNWYISSEPLHLRLREITETGVGR